MEEHTFNSQVPAQKGFRHIDMLQLDMDFVCRSVAELSSGKFATRAEESAGVAGDNL